MSQERIAELENALESARRERDELEVWSVVARGRGQTIEALTVDLAATKAALAEAMDALDAIAANAYFQPNEFARRKVAALKAKVQP